MISPRNAINYGRNKEMNLGNKYGEKQKERKNLKHLIAYMKLGLSPESKFDAKFFILHSTQIFTYP